MDAFWAGLAVGFGILLFDRMGKESGMISPGLPSARPGVGPGGQPGSGPYASVAAPAAPSTPGCTVCGPSCGSTPNQPDASVLGTPFAPAPTNLPPATPYTGNDQWNAGVGVVPGGGTAAWGVN